MVVSNTSPLLNLAIIKRLELLRDLYQQTHVPEAVWRELIVEGKPGGEAIASAPWIQTHSVQNRHFATALHDQLDAGE